MAREIQDLANRKVFQDIADLHEAMVGQLPESLDLHELASTDGGIIRPEVFGRDQAPGAGVRRTGESDATMRHVWAAQLVACAAGIGPT